MMQTTARSHVKTAAVFAAALAAMFTTLLFFAPHAHAIYAENELGGFKAGTHTVMLDPTKSSLANTWGVYDGGYKGKLTSIKSSNTSVVKIANASKNGFDICFKKAGKATVTYKFKGKKYTHNFVVLKYKSPVKKFRIGDVGYAAKFKKKAEAKATESAVGQKLIVKAKKNWKVATLIITTKNNEKHKKSGYVIKKADKEVVVFWVNKKNGASAVSKISLK